MIGIGIGIPFIRVSRGAAIDAQAQAHFDRVIADGGLVPSGLSGVNAFFTTVKSIYATSDITTAISVGLDAQVLGYKLGAGAGTTLGQAAQKLYSCSGASGDVVQTTAASQPLLLVHEGENYYQGVGFGGNNITTPSNVNNELVNDFSIEFKVQPLVLNTTQAICAKDGGAAANRQFQFRFNSAFLSLVVDHSSGTQLVYNSTTSVPFSANTLFWVRVSRNSTTGIIQFFTSPDGVTYTQLGTNVSGYIGSLSNPNRVLEIGTTVNTVAVFNGKLFEGRIFKDSTFTTPTQFFNPNQYNAANSQTQWVSTSGETWTINTGTATTGYKGQIVTKTIVMSDGVDDKLGTNLQDRLINSSRTLYSADKVLSSATTVFKYGFAGANNQLGYAIQSGRESMYLGGGGTTSQYFQSTFNASNLLNLLAYSYSNSNGRGISKNNSTIQYNTEVSTNTNSATPFEMFNLLGGSFIINMVLNTIIITKSDNTLTERTSMYNYIRSINGSAF
jgi:hypothetical protein